MDFKKLSNLQKWYLKYTSNEAYKNYKLQLQQHNYESFKKKQLEKNNAAFEKKSIQHAGIFREHLYKPITSFKHSGNSGDIIYSLPAVFELSKKGKAHFYLAVNQAADYQDNYHPLGNVMLSTTMAEMFRPLLLFQPQIEKVNIYNSEKVDYDLDDFREYVFHLDKGSLVKWYLILNGISYNSSLPWLTAAKDEQYANKIVIARSHRYRSPVINYSFLKKYPNKIFLGVESEFEDMKKSLPDLEYQPIKDFLEMATIINSCKLFIGNQSFPFSLAEALKVNRLLEVSYEVPNVITEGEGANDFMFQPQFEYAVERLFKPL